MAPLVVLAAAFIILYVVTRDFWTSLRFALAAMFLLTASAHWGKRRPDLIRMVPPAFPVPDLLVSITGVLEILGAAGLLLPATARYAAGGLSLLLVVIFPANVHAARKRLSIAGQPVPALIPRTILQVLFLAATLAVAFHGEP